MSETVASALQILRPDGTRETRLFIRMMDQFFDCLNVKSPKMGILHRKDYCLPYTSPSDHCFKVYVCINKYVCYNVTFLHFFSFFHCSGCLKTFWVISKSEKKMQKLNQHQRKRKWSGCLSRQTLQGIKMTGIFLTC